MVYRIRVYFFSIEKSGSMMFTFKSMKNPSRFAPRFLVVTTFLSALIATDVMAQAKSDYLAGKDPCGWGKNENKAAHRPL